MTLSDTLAILLVVAGAAFFLVGIVGVLRLPDIYTRLHALTKVDNVGLGLVVFGLAVHAGSWITALKLFMIWALVLLSAATASHLIAQAAMRRGVKPWTR